MASETLDRELSEVDVLDIVETFRLTNLEDVYIRLGLRQKDIEDAKLAYPKKQTRNILNLWRNRNGQSATRSALVKAIEECPDCRASLQILKRKWNIALEETPAEILARGPEAQKAYLDASRDGTKPVFRTRLMLVGQERVGKTSLMKNLTGQRFVATERTTDGVDASTLCEVPVNSEGEPWNKQNSAIADRVKSQRIEAFSIAIVQRLTELGETQQNIDELEEEKILLSTMQDMKQLPDNPQDSHEGTWVDSASLSDAVKDVDPEVAETEVILRRVRQLLREKRQGLKDGNTKRSVMEFQIWDFAGQDVYYTTHQVFLGNRAIYMVIFDLSHDLRERHVNDEVQSGYNEITGLEFLDFWMHSIYAYATTFNKPTNDVESKPTNDVKRLQLSPPIFVVGTHRGDISHKKRDESIQMIKDMIKRKPYKEHVVITYYAIENSSTDQKDVELTRMRKKIASVASREPYMGKQIPLKWLTFETNVAKAITEGQHYMNLEQVRELTQDLGINEKEPLFTMLLFYHDLGTIIFFGDRNTYLQDMVILDPQWLIDVFKKVITVMPDQDDESSLFGDQWDKLKETGILEEKLINHMWRDNLPQKPALLALMEMFDLLCPRMDEKEEFESFYVPACLKPCTDEKFKQEWEDGGEPANLYIDFHGFLPDGLFHRLLVHAARKSQQDSGEKPHLFYFRHGSFYLDDVHRFQLEMQTSSPIRIKVSVCKMRVWDGAVDNSNSNVEAGPSPNACSTVRKFLDDTLKKITGTWIRGIKYSFSLACPSCDTLHKSQPKSGDTSKRLHLICLDDCLRKKTIKCKGMAVPTKCFNICLWFHTQVHDEVEQIEKANMTLSEVELLELAGEVGIHWKKLGLHLGLSLTDVYYHGNQHNETEDKAVHILLKWRDDISKNANERGLLAKALQKCSLDGLARRCINPKGEMAAAAAQGTITTGQIVSGGTRKRHQTAAEFGADASMQTVLTVVSDTDVVNILDTFKFDELNDVYIQLGLVQKDIDNARLDGNNAREKERKVLNLWRQKESTAATRDKLFDAMKECKDSKASMDGLKNLWGYPV